MSESKCRKTLILLEPLNATPPFAPPWGGWTPPLARRQGGRFPPQYLGLVLPPFSGKELCIPTTGGGGGTLVLEINWEATMGLPEVSPTGA